MSDGIYAATSGALAQLQQLDNVSNNLANVNTAGFKKQNLQFQQVLHGQELAFAVAGDSTTSTQQGSFEKTDRPFDVALSGPGFLTVETTRGERLTRNGHLNVNQEGVLVSQDGAPVLDVDSRRIELNPALKYTIARDGTISSDGARVAQLRLVEASNLRPEGASLFSADQVVDSKRTTLEVGHIEGANVSPIEQMTRLIELNRLYDATMSAIKTYNEVDSKTANEMTR